MDHKKKSNRPLGGNVQGWLGRWDIPLKKRQKNAPKILKSEKNVFKISTFLLDQRTV